MIRARREALLAMVHRLGECDVGTLAGELATSSSTVRRDLAALERQGLVDRTWGGARAHVALRYGHAFARRAAQGARAKHAVALAAAAMVEPNMVVALSGGTTCTLVARMLRGRPINVVTNAVNVAAELYGARPTKTILTGGALKANSYELVGAGADALVRRYHFDLVFFSCSGADDAAFWRRDHAEAAMVRSFMEAADRRVVLLDRSKVGKASLARVAGLDDVDLVVVDAPAPAAWARRLAASGVDLHQVAPVPRDVPDAAGRRP